MIRLFISIIFLMFSQTTCFSQQAAHPENDWQDPDFQARVQGVYDWINSGPDNLFIIFDPKSLPPGYPRRAPLHVTETNTVNRNIKFFPARVPQNREERRRKLLPKEWRDREYIIKHFLTTPDVPEGFFEEFVNEYATADTYYLMGNIYYMQEKFHKAIASYKKAIYDFPKFRLAHKNIAYAYMRLNKCKEAVPHAQKAIKFGTFNIFLNAVLGVCYLKKEKYQSAAAALSYARMQDVENKLWFDLELEAKVKAGKYENTETFIKKILSQNPHINKYYDYQTELYRAKGDEISLLANLEIKRRMGKVTAEDLNSLNKLKIRKSVPQLVNNKQELIFRYGDTPTLSEINDIFHNIAVKKGWDEAKAFSEDALQKLSSDFALEDLAEITVLKALALQKSRQNKKALKILDRLLLKYPLHCNALLLKADIHENMGQNSQAELYLNRAQYSSKICRTKSFAFKAKMMLDQNKFLESLNLYRLVSQRENMMSGQKDQYLDIKIKTLTELIHLGSP